MPSATEALNRDSIAASSAMVKAGAVSAPRVLQSMLGREGRGSVFGRLPKACPMVVTGNENATETAVMPGMPTSMAGILGQKRRLSRVMITVPAASPSAAQLMVWK